MNAHPPSLFVDDTPNKNQLVTAAFRQLAEQWLMLIYHSLEAR